MKIGDLVMDCFYDDVGIVASEPRLSLDCDTAVLGVMTGDIYHVVEILCPDGSVRLFTTDELSIVNESR